MFRENETLAKISEFAVMHSLSANAKLLEILAQFSLGPVVNIFLRICSYATCNILKIKIIER